MAAHKETESSDINGDFLWGQNLEQVAKAAGYKSSQLASLWCISERHLQRIFKKYAQCTPSHWLRNLQCRLAKELIAQGYSSKAAAAELNFATEAHFCREFKKIFGASPQTFAPNHVRYLRLAMLEKAVAPRSKLRSAGVPVR